MTLDLMGQRYSKLPSEVLKTGTTLDLMILGIALKSNQPPESGQSTPRDYTQEELQALLNKTKNKNG